jgi:NAD+ synthase (glutamine-hydrolysing)
MKIALCQINTTVGAFRANVDKVAAAAERAKTSGCDLAVFPELTLTGYPPRDLLDRPGFLRRAEEALLDAAARAKILPVLVGTVTPNTGKGKPLFNTAVLLQDGKVAALRRKTLLPNYDVFDEDRYFEPCPAPEGPLEFADTRIGVTICEDLWVGGAEPARELYARDPVADLSGASCDFLVNLSASPFHHAKLSAREEMARQAALKAHAPVLYCNLVGGNDELVFDGYSLAVDSGGVLMSRAKGFEEDLLVVEAPDMKPSDRSRSPGETEALWRALVLGLQDYLAKCGFKQALVGLSGGIDSALVAALAAEALGPDNVLGVTMPSPYSSRGSMEDSEALARNLKIGFLKVPITPLFEQSLLTLKPAFQGRGPDLTEENLQARLRGLVLMALSNKFNRMVLSTGNKSELSMGYCTLYGDMCGGLAVISDLLKTQVYDLSRYANRDGEKIPKEIFAKPPSAELKPNQRDQDTLPPYDVLDTVLKTYVEQNKPADEIAQKGISEALVGGILRAVDASEYKRRQMAPGLKVTPKAFGIGRRIPIAQKYREGEETKNRSRAPRKG